MIRNLPTQDTMEQWSRYTGSTSFGALLYGGKLTDSYKGTRSCLQKGRMMHLVLRSLFLLLQLERIFLRCLLGEHPRQLLPEPLVLQLDKKKGGCEHSKSFAVSKVTSPLPPTLGLRNPEMTTASGLCVQKWEMSLTRSSPVSNQNCQPIDSGTKWLDHFARKPYALVQRRPMSNNSI